VKRSTHQDKQTDGNRDEHHTKRDVRGQDDQSGYEGCESKDWWTLLRLIRLDEFVEQVNELLGLEIIDILSFRLVEARKSSEDWRGVIVITIRFDANPVL